MAQESEECHYLYMYSEEYSHHRGVSSVLSALTSCRNQYRAAFFTLFAEPILAEQLISLSHWCNPVSKPQKNKALRIHFILSLSNPADFLPGDKVKICSGGGKKINKVKHFVFANIL